MAHLFWISAGMAVLSNIGYHLCQRFISQTANPIISLMLTYIVALVATAALLPFFGPVAGFSTAVRELNWASAALGLSLVLMEVGFLLFYRAGWNVSIGQIFVGTVVTLLLLPIGVILLKEKLVTTNYVGISFALVGIYLMTRK